MNKIYQLLDLNIYYTRLNAFQSNLKELVVYEDAVAEKIPYELVIWNYAWY